MTYEELGQQIKAKYPVYNQYPDEEIGKRVATKYPQYASLITEKTIEPIS